MTVVALVLDALATYRLTKLVVDDTLTAEARDAVVRTAYEAAGRRAATEVEHPEVLTSRLPDAWATCVVPNDPDPPKLATLATCPWCASVYIGFGVVALRHFVPGFWRPIARALAFSAVAGLVSQATSA